MKLIKFYTDWCGPCKMLTNVLNNMDLSGVELVEVDASNGDEMVQKHKITSVPVMIFENDGQVIDRLDGFQPEENIQGVIDKMRREKFNDGQVN